MKANRFRFRAWDKDEEKMYHHTVVPSSLTFVNDDTWRIEDDCGELTTEAFAILMQSTGLTDSKGREIFEGDVVEIKGEMRQSNFGKPNHYQVVHGSSSLVTDTPAHGGGTWGIHAEHFIYSIHKVPSIMNEEELQHTLTGINSRVVSNAEVIGNVYENPELMEEVQ